MRNVFLTLFSAARMSDIELLATIQNLDVLETPWLSLDDRVWCSVCHHSYPVREVVISDPDPEWGNVRHVSCKTPGCTGRQLGTDLERVEVGTAV